MIISKQGTFMTLHALLNRLARPALFSCSLLLLPHNVLAAPSAQSLADDVQAQVVQWRRHFHQHPELSNREFNTAKTLAAELTKMGLEVKTGIAHNGVVGYLKGAKPGPTVALRADIDALPVVEQTDLPFASKAKGTFRGKEVGVMHACGHDTHMAILLGVAKSLSQIKAQLTGNVLFIFQPAEEGAPKGEEGGAELMLKEGLFDTYKPDVAFGLHSWSALNAGQIGYRSGPAMASADQFEIIIKGRQTHGSRPWGGVDPIVVAAQTVMAVQTIASRQVNVTKAPSIISFGVIEGGIRNNIIPDSVKLIGTIRNFDMGIRDQIHKKLKITATHVAKAAGAEALVNIDLGYPVTVNNPKLVKATLPSLTAVVGEQNMVEMDLVTGAEDFSYFASEVPGFFYFLGSTEKGIDAKTAPSNHSPLFRVDESSLKVGVQSLLQATLDYMSRQAGH
jgi:amidohydrolase